MDYERTALFLLFVVVILLSVEQGKADGILYPQASEKRQLNSLDGLWNFRAVDQSNQQQGFDEGWYNRPLKQVNK